MKMLWILTMLLAMGSPLSAQEPQEPPPDQCFNGEYVLTISNSQQLRRKVLATLDYVSDEPLEIAQGTSTTVLIQEASTSNFEPEIVAHQPTRDLCGKYRRQLRDVQRESRESGDPTVVRRYSCSCNAVLRLQASTPNDPFVPQQWGIHQDNDVDIDAPEAWDISRGSQSVLVGVIDSGVDYNHPDLSPNMWVNPLEVAGNGIDDDANGYVDDIHGINAMSNSGNPMDDNGHGTHVAGTIGAKGDNGTGVTGVAWNVRMVGIKFLGSNGNGSLFDAVKAIDYATSLKQRGENMRLTNNSWGSTYNYAPISDAISRSQQAGILFVAASGNSAVNTDSTPFYPAMYSQSNVIPVGAINSAGALASFSNYGSKVLIAAPGDKIASTYLNGQYVYLSGTSMAAPHVSGALAVLAAAAPTYSASQLKQLLLDSTDKRSALLPYIANGNSLNLNTALRALSSNPPSTPTPSPSAMPSVTPSVQPTASPGPSASPSTSPTVSPTYTPAPTPAPSYKISGVIKYGLVPLAEAQVTLTIGGQSLVRVTGPTGAFDFGAQLSGRSYSISVSRPGYTVSTVYRSSFSSDQLHTLTATQAEIMLMIRAINEARLPVQGVTVNAGPYGSKLTDSTGWASFSVPYGADYTVYLSSSTNELSRSMINGKVWGTTMRAVVAIQ